MDEIDSQVSAAVGGDSSVATQSVLLFYKFHPLSKEREVVELYRAALNKLCQSLGLQGRILVGCNEHQSEGINGTLSGSPSATESFVRALTRQTKDHAEEANHQEVIFTFWKDCDEFYAKAGCQPLVMDPSDFKWSTCSESQLFPDLNIKIVKELIGTGGVLAPISLDEVHKGYLTPSEWHERITQLQRDEQSKEDTVLIDCRNTKEWQIGHFPGAPDPSTTTFNQFPHWVEQHSQALANKKVLMYCTGGIRCEKASAFIRNKIPSVKEVCHLKGGIHKYLDQYGSSEDCLWKGKNFVFDGRGAQAAGHGKRDSTDTSDIVGHCLYCTKPYDVFEPGCVCTVCREPTLVCPECREGLREFHCHNHSHLRNCYFTDLSPYSVSELQGQLKGLNESLADIAVGKKFRQKRKTLMKQCEKVVERLALLHDSDGTGDATMTEEAKRKCRNCGETGCSGNCWGFYGLNRKRVLEEMQRHSSGSEQQQRFGKNRKADGTNSYNNPHLQEKKATERQSTIDELMQLQLASTPSTCRNEETGIRIPTACTRILQSNVKGKWCGKSLLAVLQHEFADLVNTETLTSILKRGLLRVNNQVVASLEEAETIILKNMDVIGRITHWHEPPIHIPDVTIDIQKIRLPDDVQREFGFEDDATLYVSNKPSTVPVHPAGPYLSNSLTMMVEAQESLTPKSLIPCHRIDRVTSGLTICCTNTKVARLVQSRIESGCVKKQYLAKVHGRFPSTKEHVKVESSDISKWNWIPDEYGDSIEVKAPIETVDPGNGIRKITPEGKPASSLFRFISYDDASDTSMVLCSPLTGRSHQLRLHLEWLRHSVVNDVLYGGSIDPALDLSAGLSEAKRRRQAALDGGGESLLRPSTMAEEDVKAAMEICAFCSVGPEAAFSSAQLLQGGHQICLHAFRYRIPFHPKKKGLSESEVLLGEVDLKVGLPAWAFGTDRLLELP